MSYLSTKEVLKELVERRNNCKKWIKDTSKPRAEKYYLRQAYRFLRAAIKEIKASEECFNDAHRASKKCRTKEQEQGLWLNQSLSKQLGDRIK